VDANDHVFVLPSPPTTNEKTFAQDFVDTPFAKRAFEKSRQQQRQRQACDADQQAGTALKRSRAENATIC
jgi:hypothetical protein